MTDIHVYDTTLRDGAQQEGLNLSVADKLAIARHLDELGVGFIEGGWPGANPKDTEFFRRAQPSSSCGTPRSPRSAPPAAPASRPPTTRRCARCSTPGAASSRSSPRRTTGHVERALRTTLAENLAMIRDTVVVPARAGPAGLPRRRALLRRLRRQPRLRARGRAGRRRGRRRGRRPVRHQRRDAARPGRRRRRTTCVELDRRAGRHPQPQRHRLRGRQLAGRRRRRRHPRAGHGQRLRRAHRQRQPAHRRRQPRSSRWACRVLPHRLPARRPGSRTRSPRSPTSPPYSRQPYVGS